MHRVRTHLARILTIPNKKKYRRLECINIGDVLGKAFKNIFTKRGFHISLLYFIFYGLPCLAVSGLTLQSIPTDINPSFFVFAGIAGILYVILSILVMVGVLRSLYHKELKAEYFTDSIGFTGLNLVADGILTGIAVLIGFILFIIPGFIAIVALSLSPLYIVVKHDNVIDALKNSWETTKGHWLQIFAVVFVVWVISLVINLLTTIPDVVATLVGGSAQYIVLAITTYISVYTSLLQTSAVVELYRALS